jgi:HD superfamily phosphodiesterase
MTDTNPAMSLGNGVLAISDTMPDKAISLKVRTLTTAVAVCAAIIFGSVPVAYAGQSRPVPNAPAVSKASHEIVDLKIPESKLVRDAVQAVRSAEGELLFQHSMRVYYWAAFAGKRKGLSFDPDLLFVAAMFHDYGLTAGYRESRQRYEVDGADAARDFLQKREVPETEAQKVWLAISLHTTNGVSPHLDPVASLLAEAANMDLVGAGFSDFTAAQRGAVEAAHPREAQFSDDFMQALYDSLKHRPETTQGTGLADVMAYKDPQFPLRNFSKLMLHSPWTAERCRP